MTFPAASLVPLGGEIESHIFENASTGIERDHFWAITVPFAPIEYDGEWWDCTLSCEWLRFAIRHWRDLDRQSLSGMKHASECEASFYLTRHDPGTLTELSLTHVRSNRFRLQMRVVVDFQGCARGDENPEMLVTVDTEVEYSELTVVPESLFPKPSTPEEVVVVASDYVDISAYNRPQRDGHRFIMKPS